MKTLKKVLAVVLALAMVLGMTVTASAAFAGETINADYKEAVDVMNAIGILVGDANGKFNPTNTLTRADACKIITYMLGQENYSGKGAFTDCNGHWAASYIGFCAAQGIVDGIGGGKFNPNGQLTGYAFAKMLAVALGYNAKLEGMTGSNWEAGVAKVVKEADLADGIDTFAASKAISREEAAQVAFNALFTPMVEYATTINSDGVITYSKTSTTNYATNTGKTLAAENFAKLTKVPEQDTVNGEASHTWYYKGTKIGTYSDAEKAIVTYSGRNMKKSSFKSQVEADLAAYEVKSSVVFYANNDDFHIDGGNVKATVVNRIVEEVKNGRTVAVYGSYNATEKANLLTKVVIIDELVGKVTKVATKTTSVEVYKNSNVVATFTVTAPTADSTKAYEAFYNSVRELKKGDYFTFTADLDGVTVLANAKVEDVAGTFIGKCEKVAAVKATAKSETYKGWGSDFVYTIGGEKYQVSCNGNASIEVGTTYNLYLDSKGYVVAASKVDDTIAYVADIYDNNAKRGSKEVTAYVLYNDGTIDDIKLDAAQFTEGTTYATFEGEYVTLTNSSKGYKLANLANGFEFKVDAAQTLKANYAKEVKLESDTVRKYMNGDTVVFVYDDDAQEYTAYTYDAIPTIYLDKAAKCYVDTAENGSNRIVSIVIDSSKNAVNEITNVYLESTTGTIVDVNDDTYVEWNAVVDGDVTKVFVLAGINDGSDSDKVTDAGLYAVKATLADEGYITELAAAKTGLAAYTADDAGVYAYEQALTIKKTDYTVRVGGVGFGLEDTVASGFDCYYKNGSAIDVLDIDDVQCIKNAYVAVNAQGEIAWMFVTNPTKLGNAITVEVPIPAGTQYFGTYHSDEGAGYYWHKVDAVTSFSYSLTKAYANLQAKSYDETTGVAVYEVVFSNSDIKTLEGFGSEVTDPGLGVEASAAYTDALYTFEILWNK